MQTQARDTGLRTARHSASSKAGEAAHIEVAGSTLTASMTWTTVWQSKMLERMRRAELRTPCTSTSTPDSGRTERLAPGR